MGNPLSAFLKKRLLAGRRNLVSLDDPYKVMARLLAGADVKVIVDAGASSGRLSRRFLRLFPGAGVYAFEPQPLYEATLKDLAARCNRFHPQFCALSDGEGTAALHITDLPGSTSLLAPNERLLELAPQGSRVCRTVDVPVVTLDGWARRLALPGVEVMKFDIQGAELKALRGGAALLNSSTLAVYTEVLFDPLYADGAGFGELDSFLRGAGFVLYDLYGPKYDRRGMLLWADALYLHEHRLGLSAVSRVGR